MLPKNILSDREKGLPDLEMARLLEIMNERKDIISLGPGQPDFNPPKHVIKAACDAMKKGETKYSPAQGRKELLKAVSKKLKKDNKVIASPDEIIITTGSNEAIMLAFMATLDKGEKIMVPTPCFLDFIPAAEIIGGRAATIPTCIEDDFQLDLDAIRKKVKKDKKIISMVVNTPCNPTGTVYPKKVLEELADIAIENKILLISDEAYEKFIYKGKHVSLGSLNGMKDHVLTLQSFSKTYGMPGFRVGYAAGPKKLINAMEKLHIYVSLSAPTVSQLAAVAALNGKQEWPKHVKEYNKRRKFIYKRLKEIPGFHPNEPQGAF